MPISRADLARRIVDSPRLRVVRHESDLCRWESVSRDPDPRLLGVVDGMYQGWVEESASFASRREVPAAVVPLILNLGPPYRVAGPLCPEGTTLGTFLAGLHDSFATVESTGPSRCLQVNFTPLGASLLLGQPMHGLANRSLALDDILGSEARRLVDRLGNQEGWEARFAILDAFLLGRLAKGRVVSARMIRAWAILDESDGRIAIGTLAAEVGWSHKHLIERFKEHVGLPPKQIATILRFQGALRRLDEARPPSLAGLAIDCGYYDQAHMIRDFQALAGGSPREILGRLLPDGGGMVGDAIGPR